MFYVYKIDLVAKVFSTVSHWLYCNELYLRMCTWTLEMMQNEQHLSFSDVGCIRTVWSGAHVHLFCYVYTHIL